MPALLDDVETMVFAVVEGIMSEWRSEADGREPWKVNVRFEGLTEQSEGSDGGPEPLDLPTEPHRWAPWPLRAG